MTVRIVEQALSTDNGGEATVRAEQTGAILVKWPCGDARRFTQTDLKAAMAAVEALKAHPDVWVNVKDSDGRVTAARLSDGTLFADSRPTDQARGVTWEDFKKVVRKATA